MCFPVTIWGGELDGKYFSGDDVTDLVVADGLVVFGIEIDGEIHPVGKDNLDKLKPNAEGNQGAVQSTQENLRRMIRKLILEQYGYRRR